MHENRHCKKKIGSYLHSYGSPNDVEILTLIFPYKGKKIFFQIKAERRIQFFFFNFEKKNQIGWVRTKNVRTLTPQKMAYFKKVKISTSIGES